MRIGAVARDAGIGVHAVRFYEREGLIPKPARQTSGYRDFAPEVVPRLRFIKRAKALGFTLREIFELLDLDASASGSARGVKQLAERKLEDLNERIEALQRMRRALRTLAENCSARGSVRQCSILRTLDAGERK